MKKKTKILITVILAVIIAGTTCAMAFGDYIADALQLGEIFRNKTESKDIVAMYKETPVTAGMVQYRKDVIAYAKVESENETPIVVEPEKANEGSTSLTIVGFKEYDTDIEIINDIIFRIILAEEAESLGIACTDDEINERISHLKKNYEEHDEIAEELNAFCKVANMTIDEYWTFTENSERNRMSRINAENHFKENYCKENDIDYEKLTQEDYDLLNEKYDEYCADLFEAHKDDIKYYLDASE